MLTIPDSEPRGASSLKILIAHPGRQHSHQAALALFEAGSLGCYATGVPISNKQIPRSGHPFLKRYSSYDEVRLPLNLAKLNIIAPLVNRIARMLPQALAEIVLNLSYRAFDRWAAGLVKRNKYDAVICYENSALRTFRAAKKKGMVCILDAASLHRIEADTRYQVDIPAFYKKRIDRQKDLEVSLADCVFTVSDLAADTYRKHVGPDILVKSITLGADTERFKPAVVERKFGHRNLVFAFVGTATMRKGFDLLVEAGERLASRDIAFQLIVAGNIDDSLLRGKDVSGFLTPYGQMGQDTLVKTLQQADCLVLPSRFDSFAMVVPEAMACGLPVIVSDMVGAKDLVVNGQNGFVIPVGDVAALEEKMSWLIANQHKLPEMAAAARTTAENADWKSYRRRFVQAVHEVVENRPEGHL